MAETQREHLRESFKKVKYFCATTDVWSRSNISFIAVSVHYFESDTLKLQTEFIACEHFPGRHTHDRVAAKLRSIFDRFDILHRVYFVTTDGAGEYTAAFKYFGQKYRAIHLSTASNENLDWLNRSGDDDSAESNAGSSSSSNPNGNDKNSDTVDSESETDDDPEAFVRMQNDLYEGGDEDELKSASTTSNPESFCIEETVPLLANMIRIDCSSHKLDKVGKNDVELAKGQDSTYDHYHDRVFTKLQNIWSLKDSRLSAEIFSRITGKKLTGPHRIRWLKTCSAVSVLFFEFIHSFFLQLNHFKPPKMVHHKQKKDKESHTSVGSHTPRTLSLSSL